ncbi:MAG: hypothetical protein U0271_18200 [Polyangiaceae bacterium]
MSSAAAVLDDLTSAFAELGVRWYLFGAQAAILYGSTRVTEDVDVTVELGDLPAITLVRALEGRGFGLRVQDPEGFAKKARVLPLVHRATGMPVDAREDVLAIRASTARSGCHVLDRRWSATAWTLLALPLCTTSLASWPTPRRSSTAVDASSFGIGGCSLEKQRRVVSLTTTRGCPIPMCRCLVSCARSRIV